MTAPWRFLPCVVCCEPLTCDHICSWSDATAVSLAAGNIVDGTFESLHGHLYGYLEVQPGAGGLDCYVTFQLGAGCTPNMVRAAGRYEAEAGKSITVYLYDFDAAEWIEVGSWDHALIDISPWPEYALSAPYVSPTGEVRIRWQTADENGAYRLYLDVTRACHDGEPFDQYEVTFNCVDCPGLSGGYITDYAGVMTPGSYEENWYWQYVFDPPFVCELLPWPISEILLHFQWTDWVGPSWPSTGNEVWVTLFGYNDEAERVRLDHWRAQLVGQTDCDLDGLVCNVPVNFLNCTVTISAVH